MSETYRLQWDRDVHGEGAVTRRIRYRRKRGEWQEVASVNELPDDVRAAYERVRGSAELADMQTFRARRFRKRPPTRSREIDRTLYVDHPWFNGWVLMCMMIVVPYMVYNSWDGLSQGGWTAFFSGLMLALAALMAYYGLCVLFNSTEFRVDDEFLTVKHGPLPWFGNRSIPVNDVLQLSTHVHHSRHSLTYTILVTVRSGPSVVLLDSIDTGAEARSIERAIERHLGIEDWDC